MSRGNSIAFTGPDACPYGVMPNVTELIVCEEQYMTNMPGRSVAGTIQQVIHAREERMLWVVDAPQTQACRMIFASCQVQNIRKKELILVNLAEHLWRRKPMAKLQVVVLALEGFAGLLLLIMLLVRAYRYWRSRK